MKVAVVAGSARSLLNFRGTLLATLQASGHAVAACASGADPRILAGLRALGVTYHEVSLERRGSNPLADLRYWLALRRFVRAEQPDLLLAYTMKPVVYAALASGTRRPPSRFWLITGLGSGFDDRSLGQRLTQTALRGLLAVAIRRSDGVIFQNEDDQGAFAAMGLLGQARTTVVGGSGVDLSRFPSVPLPAGPPRFLMLARLIRAKGAPLFVEAARIVKGTHRDAQFVLAGGVERGPDAVNADAIEAWQRSGLVDYLGRLDDVRDELARCTACVLPSYYREGTPRSLLEAMSTGRAIVTTDMPGCRHTVVDAGPPDTHGVRLGVNGLLVPPRSGHALAAALGRIIETPGLAASLGAAGRRTAERVYDARLVDRRMLDFMGIGQPA